MKLEQVCRFRTETGYRVCAQSPGFTAEHETEMGKIFNDTMNPLFAKLGQSVFTCAMGECGSIFVSRSTLRSSYGRTTMFTHTYILKPGEYEQLMEQNAAAALLSLSMEDMFYTQPATADIGALSLDSANGAVPELDQLRAKYHLHDSRYAQLLLGAYRAITTSASLCLHTSLPLEETPKMVRELAFCIAVGLLPMLKGRLTYSSATDARMKVCVSSTTGGQSVGKPNIHFAVDENISLPPARADPMSDAFFQALVHAADKERHALLDQMQRWLSDLLEESEGTSLGMIVAAYHLSSGQKLNNDEAARLLSNVLNGSKSGSVNQQALNHVLTQLINILYAGKACPNTLPQLAERCIRFSDASYDEAVRHIIELAPESTCIELLSSLLHLSSQVSPSVKAMAAALLDRIPAGGEALAGTLGNRLIAWVLAQNATELNRRANYLVERKPPEEQKALAADILTQSLGHELSSCAAVLLLSLLKMLCSPGAARQNAYLGDACCNMLDIRFSSFPAVGQEVLLDYFFTVRLPQASNPVETLQKLKLEHPNVFDAAVSRLKDPKYGQSALWESYQTALLLPDGLNYHQLNEICRKHNNKATFLGSGGPFERRAAQLWLACLESKLELSSDFEDRKSILIQEQKKRDELHLSRVLKEQIKIKALSLFWSGVSYRDIFRCTAGLPGEWMKSNGDEEIGKKARAMRCVQDALKDPLDIAPIQELLLSSGGLYSAAERTELHKGLYTLAVLLVGERQFLSWDLLLLRSYIQDEGEDAPNYHCSKVADDVTRMEKHSLLVPELHAPLDQSNILRSSSLLRREMYKVINHKSPRLLQELGEELREYSRASRQREERGKAPAADQPASASQSVDKGDSKAVVSGFLQNLFGRKTQSDSTPDEGRPVSVQPQEKSAGYETHKKGGKRKK